MMLVLVFVAACRPSADEARSWLASTDPTKRRDGALALQKMYEKEPMSVGDHGEAYWADRVARIRGLTATEAFRILEHPKSMGSEAGGGGATEAYRLDDFWVVTLHRSTREDDRIFGTTPPRRVVVDVDVPAPNAFTGTWMTYFVNGAVYESIELERGVRRRVRVFHDNGKLRYERRYVEGKFDGTVLSRDANGVPEWEETYAMGKQVGNAKMYHPNGTLRQEAHYADGRLDGTMRNFSENGTVTFCAEYRAAVQVDGGCAP
jgi:hypothetical protein